KTDSMNWLLESREDIGWQQQRSGESRFDIVHCLQGRRGRIVENINNSQKIRNLVKRRVIVKDLDEGGLQVWWHNGLRNSCVANDLVGRRRTDGTNDQQSKKQVRQIPMPDSAICGTNACGRRLDWPKPSCW